MISETMVPANPDILDGVNDLMQLSYLNEPSVLYNLQYRYDQDMIYVSNHLHVEIVLIFRFCHTLVSHVSVHFRQKQGQYWLLLIPLRKFHYMEMIILKLISANLWIAHMYMPSQIQLCVK